MEYRELKQCKDKKIEKLTVQNTNIKWNNIKNA